MVTGFYTRGIQKTALAQNNISKYIIESQDFLVKNNQFRSSDFYTNPIKITIASDKHTVYVDNVLLSEISPNKTENVIYQVFAMQQYQTHIMMHLLSTYVYNLFMERDVFAKQTFKNHPLFNCLKDLLADISAVTDGHGKYDLFSLGGDNSGKLCDTEVFSFATALSEKYCLLTKDLSSEELVLMKTKQVYNVYVNVVSKHITDTELTELSKLIEYPETDCKRMLINVLFMSSYYHTKAHDILKYLNSDTRLIYILLNQADVARHTQTIKPQPFLSKIQNEIKTLGIGEETYVCNAHNL